jgi:hypothetical protein
LVYREKSNVETLEKYAQLVFETAEFMADFARWDAEKNRYILGPPLIPAQESLEKEKHSIRRLRLPIGTGDCQLPKNGGSE